jgi:hypothetical protein
MSILKEGQALLRLDTRCFLTLDLFDKPPTLVTSKERHLLLLYRRAVVDKALKPLVVLNLPVSMRTLIINRLDPKRHLAISFL